MTSSWKTKTLMLNFRTIRVQCKVCREIIGSNLAYDAIPYNMCEHIHLSSHQTQLFRFFLMIHAQRCAQNVLQPSYNLITL